MSIKEVFVVLCCAAGMANAASTWEIHGQVIAELEKQFLGESVSFGAEFGCPAVRLQVRALKRSKERPVIDTALTDSLNRTDAVIRSRDPEHALAADKRFWARFDRHTKTHDEWRDRTEAKIETDLKRAVTTVIYQDELVGPHKEYQRQLRRLIDLEKQWLREEREHLDNLKPPDVNVSEYGESMRKWMRRWESIWEL